MPDAIAAAAATLERLGWNPGVVSRWMAFGIVWQVETHKVEQSIVARADTESEAWAIAARRAWKLSESGTP